MLNEMVNYYRVRANKYDEWFYRRGRYDHGPDANARWFAEVDAVFTALDGLKIELDNFLSSVAMAMAHMGRL